MMKLVFQPARDVIRQSLDFLRKNEKMCQMAVAENYSPPKLMVGQITHDQISGAFGYPATRVVGPSRRVVGPLCISTDTDKESHCFRFRKFSTCWNFTSGTSLTQNIFSRGCCVLVLCFGFYE